MGLYIRKADSPFYWKKYPVDPITKIAPRKPASTGICWDAPTKALRDQNKRDAEMQYAQDLLDIRSHKKVLPAILFADYATTIYIPQNTALLRGNEESTINTLVKDFGHHLLTAITIDVVREWRASKISTLKASTINLYVSVLTKMLTRAVPTYLETNVLAAYKHGTQRKQLERLDEKDFEARAFSDDEFKDFMKAIDSQDMIKDIPKAEGIALAYCAVETLVRRGSLMKLTWPDDKGTKFVTKDTKVSRGKSKAPKTKPITPHMRVCLDDLPRKTTGNLIFPSFHINKGGYKQQAQIWFREVCALAKLPYGRAVQGLTFHSFRHTGATWYLKKGYSVKAVMQLGGWTNAQLFLDTYVHVSEEEIADMVKTMSAELHPRRFGVLTGGKSE